MSGAGRETSVAAGVLYVVATPIGNLGDFSDRAREVLAKVALIAAEDTRHTRQLLQAFGIGTAMTSLHEHNEMRRSEALVERLLGGESVALVSDAGTPLISDPGFDLVAVARSRGIQVVAIPGPCAAIAALSIAGIATDRFVFEGFLPAKQSQRRQRLETLLDERRTMVFYEAPHRLGDALRDMAEVLGGTRQACVGRELTKRFESTYAGSLQQLAAQASEDADMSRGELVIVVAGETAPVATAQALDAQRVLRVLMEDLSPAQAAKIAAKLTGEKRGDMYARAVQLSGG